LGGRSVKYNQCAVILIQLVLIKAVPMRVGRVSIVKNASEDAVFALRDSYEKDFDYNFPTATSAVVVQTGPTSTLTVTLDPNEEAANRTLYQFQKSLTDMCPFSYSD
jgi:hypothetical protein